MSFASDASSLQEVTSRIARYGSCLAAFLFLAGTVYFDASTALWNQAYKTSMLSGGGAACERLWQKVESGLDYGGRSRCRIPAGDITRRNIDALFRCLRSDDKCSNVRTSELMKIAGADDLGLAYGRSICDSPALASAQCHARLDSVVSTRGESLLSGLGPSAPAWIVTALSPKLWGDLCAKKCGLCREPLYVAWDEDGDLGAPGAESGDGASSISWALKKARTFLGNERRLAAGRGRAAGADQFAGRAWLTGDWTCPAKDVNAFELDRKRGRQEAAGGIYFSPELQDAQCPWYLVEARSVDRTLFEWQEKEAMICGKSKRTAAECRSLSRCVWLDDERAPLYEEGAGCYFKTCDAAKGGRCYRRRAHTYGKAESLFMQSAFGVLLYWGLNYVFGGCDQFRRCFEFTELIKFSAVGTLFGLSSLFAFLAQASLTPGTYMIFCEAGVIIIPLMWRAGYRTAIPSLTWMHMGLVGLGIAMYMMAEVGDPSIVGEDVVKGLVCIAVKVVLTGLASVFSEACVTNSGRSRGPAPFLVQSSYIFVWKAVACLAAVYVLPPHRLPPSDVRFGGIFHDWNLWVLIVLGHGLCDTLFSALISPAFDSVIKALCGVLGIVFPTMLVGYLLGWERLDFSTTGGKLKVCGAVVVIFSASAYVLGRAQARELLFVMQEAAERERSGRDDGGKGTQLRDLDGSPDSSPEPGSSAEGDRMAAHAAAG